MRMCIAGKDAAVSLGGTVPSLDISGEHFPKKETVIWSPVVSLWHTGNGEKQNHFLQRANERKA